MYADYAYYKDSFGGDLTAEEFNRYARKAERFLNYVIMGEIPEVTEQVKNAVCAAAEAVAEIRGGVANIPQGIKSESTMPMSLQSVKKELCTRLSSRN